MSRAIAIRTFIGIFAVAVGLYCYFRFAGDTTYSKRESTKQAMKSIADALLRYKKLYGNYPSKSDGIEVLVYRASLVPDVAGLKDAWGKEYTIDSANNEFWLRSSGENGLAENGNGDDISLLLPQN